LHGKQSPSTGDRILLPPLYEVKEYFDRVFVINKGRLITSGKVKEILASYDNVAFVSLGNKRSAPSQNQRCHSPDASENIRYRISTDLSIAEAPVILICKQPL
jgi:ABC-type multidrug transport system ATPase subunit